MDPGQATTSEAPGQTRKRIKWIRYGAAGVGFLLLLYTACGFWLVPLLIKRMLPQVFADNYGISAAVEKVFLNPFSFSAKLKGFNAELNQSNPLLSFDELYVNVNPWSVIGPRYHVQAIRLQGLHGHIIRHTDGRFHFEALLPQHSTQPDPEVPPEKRLPGLSVTRLQIVGGRLQFSDQSRPDPFATDVYPIQLEIQDFSTGTGSDNAFALNATLAQGGTVDVKGRLTVTPPESNGRILVKGFPLRTGWEYIRNWVRFEITAGAAELAVPYTVSLGDAGLQASVKDASVSLTDLKVSEKDGDPDPVVVIPSLTVQGLSADLKQKSLQVNRIASHGAWVKGWLNPDGELGLASILALEPFEDSEKTVSEISAKGAGLERQWQVGVNRVLLADWAVEYEDRTLSTPFRLQLEPIRFEMNHLSNRRNDKAELKMTVSDPFGGSVTINGRTGVRPPSADLSVQVDGIALPQFAPYLSEIGNLELKSGSLHSKGDVQLLAESTSDAPQLRFNGRVGLKELIAAEADSGKDFFRLKALDVAGIEFQLTPNRLNIAEIAINQPSTDVVIDTEGRVNVTEILKPKTGAEEKIQKSLLGRIANAVRLQVQGPIPFKIERIALESGDAGINDRSIDPAVALRLNPYRLEVTGLDSVNARPADADLKGTLGTGAVLSAAGRFNPFSETQPTEMDVSLDDFDLTGVSPYAGRYAGYAIDKGQLSLALSYTISQRMVDGTNQIRLEQLTLGEPTDSPDAIGLPLPLAVALLKDSRGNISLNLPIQGNLDDPQFQIGNVVARTLINLISSVVTSPFSVLGSIAGAFSAEELRRVGFEPGSDRLEDGEVEKLNSLTKALKDRPALKLQMKGTADRRLDRDALARRQLLNRIDALSREEMKAAGISLSTTPQAIEPGSPAYQRALIMFYRQRFEERPEAYDENDPDAFATIEEKLIQEISIERSDLLNLAGRRAERLKTYLIEKGGIAPDRLFIEAVDIVESTEGGRVHTELGVST